MTNQLLIGYNSCNSCFFGSLFCSRFVQIIFFIYKITLLGKCLVVSPLKIYELMLNFVLYMLYIIQLLVCDIVQANYQVFSYRKKNTLPTSNIYTSSKSYLPLASSIIYLVLGERINQSCTIHLLICPNRSFAFFTLF